MSIQTIHSPSGEELVVLPRAEYQDLLDGHRHAVALADLASGRMESFTEAETEATLAARTPLAFWRARRGLTQSALAEAAGISQGYLAQIETGKRTGDVLLHARLARKLGVSIEALLVEDDAAKA